MVVDEDDIPWSAQQNLMQKLDCEKETAYESFMIKLNQEFSNEVDMYGDVKKAGDV